MNCKRKTLAVNIIKLDKMSPFYIKFSVEDSNAGSFETYSTGEPSLYGFNSFSGGIVPHFALGVYTTYTLEAECLILCVSPDKLCHQERVYVTLGAAMTPSVAKHGLRQKPVPLYSARAMIDVRLFPLIN